MKVFITNIEALIKRQDIIAYLKENLCARDQKRLGQMTSQKRIAEFLAGRWLMKQCFLGAYDILPSGKIVSKKANLSLAHSGSYAVLVISSEKVGIDIEKMVANRNFEKIALKKGFAASKNADEFYRQWTAFEADFKCDAPKQTLFHTFRVYQDYMICLTALKAESIELVEVSVPLDEGPKDTD